MMASAQRHGELIADLAAEGAVLREAQMIGICGPAPANQTRLFGHEFNVLLVTKAAWLGVGQPALVDFITPFTTLPLPSAMAVLSDPTDRRSLDEDGCGANLFDDRGTSPLSAAFPSVASLALQL